MKDDQVILLLLLAGGAWYLYTRQHGLTLTGEPAHAMIDPSWNAYRPGSMSPVQSTNSTGTAATNVFSAIGSAVQTIARSITAGNNPRVPADSPYILNAGIRNPDVPVTGGIAPEPDPTLADAYPYWTWTYFDQQPTQIADLSSTLRPEDFYIPPPPGS